MATLYAFAVLFGLIAMAIGFLSFLIYPFKFLGIRTRSQGFGVFVLAIFGTGYAGYQFSSTNGSTPANSLRSGAAEVAAVTQTERAPTPQVALPQQEQGFLDAVTKAKADFESGANDMAKGAARPARARAICSVLGRREVNDWIGTVAKLSSNSDGKGVLSVTIGDGVAVETWNNDVSDYADHTLIDPSSYLFAQATKLQVGQTVRFSGRFASSPVDCVKEGSMTITGSMTEPEFIFAFDNIAAQ